MKKSHLIVLLLFAIAFQSCGGSNGFTKRKYLKLKNKQVFEENEIHSEEEVEEVVFYEEAVEEELGSFPEAVESSFSAEEIFAPTQSEITDIEIVDRDHFTQVEDEESIQDEGDPKNIQLTKFEALTDRYIRRSQVMAIFFGVWLLAFILTLLLANLNTYLVLVVLLAVAGFVILTVGFVFGLIALIAQKQWKWYARIENKKNGYDLSAWQSGRKKAWIWFCFFSTFFGLPVVAFGMYFYWFF